MTDPEAIIKWCGAASSVGALVWAVLRPAVKKLDTVTNKIDSSHTKLDKLAVRVQRVEEQVHPNGGGSMVDSVNRIETNLSTLHKDHRLLSTKFDRAEVRQGFLMRAQDLAYFETDNTGTNTFVTPQFYHDLLGATESDILGQGWRNFMDDTDIETYECEWVRAFEHKIRVDFVLPMRHANGQKVWLRVILEPVGPDDPDAFLGLVTSATAPEAV